MWPATYFLNDQERFCGGELLFVIYLFILVDVRTRSYGIKVNLSEYECTKDTLADASRTLTNHSARGVVANEDRIDQLMQSSLMLVTALNPHIGYDRATKVAKKAHEDGSSLVESGTALGFFTEEELREWVKLEEMIQPNEPS